MCNNCIWSHTECNCCKHSPQRIALRINFCTDNQANDSLMHKFIFSDKFTLYLSGKVNRMYLVHKKNHLVMEHVVAPLKLMWFVISQPHVCTGSFFTEQTVTGELYLHWLQLCLMPQIQGQHDEIIFPQDGASSHFLRYKRKYLNATLPRCSIRRNSADDVILLPVLPCLPEITPCKFILRG